MQQEYILQVDSISKSFGGVRALTDVSLKLGVGEVLAVMGENGAGKSTLMKIIAGALKADKGDIIFEGQPLKLNSPLAATKAGISIVYQEPNIFPDLSVLENIYSGIEAVSAAGTIKWKDMYEEAGRSLELVGLKPDILHLSMSELSIGNQQLVLIARGIFRKCKVLILDEPTSILSYAESEKLFEIMASLKQQGVSIMYISHRIPEILRISDNMVVLRDGNVTATMRTSEADEEGIITAMSGRAVDMDVYTQRDYQSNDVLLSVAGLGYPNAYHDISFELRPGQILGMYGLVGSGRSEIARAIFGETNAASGTVTLKGEDVSRLKSKNMVQKHVFYVPEDRGTQGLFYGHSIKDNMSVSFLDRLSNRFGLLNKKQERKAVQESIDKYSIKTPSMDLTVNSMSGGNQQKTLFCRWLLERPDILILDEPTRGIDIKTKSEIHRYIMELAESGVAIILISSDLPEVMSLADDMLILHKGSVIATCERKDFTEEFILKNALGLEEDERKEA